MTRSRSIAFALSVPLAAVTVASTASAAEALDPAPTLEGRAAPPTRVATGTPTIGPLTIGVEAFAFYSQRLSGTGEPSSDSRFDLGRLHVGARYERERFTGRVVLEGVRSTADGALVGVAGDSLVIRAREAYGALRLPFDVSIAAGIVPTLTIPVIEGTWLLRAVTATPLEQFRLATPADAGAQVHWALPRDLGTVSASVTNGEGYASREFDGGKTGEVALTVRPLAPFGVRPLALFASGGRGTVGAASVRSDRASAAALWQGAALRAGLTFTEGWGLGGDGAMRPRLLEAFVSGEPFANVLVGARATRFVFDTRGDAPTLDTVVASVGYRFEPELELHLVADLGRANDAAKLAQPAAERSEARAVLRLLF
jgi:hypothetical protein